MEIMDDLPFISSEDVCLPRWAADGGAVDALQLNAVHYHRHE